MILLSMLTIVLSGRSLLVSQVVSPIASAKTVHTPHAIWACASDTQQSLESPSASVLQSLLISFHHRDRSRVWAE